MTKETPKVLNRKWKYTSDFGGRQHFLYFRRAYTKFKKTPVVNREHSYPEVPYEVFSAVLKEYYHEIQRKLLAGERVRIPLLGSIQVMKIKMNFGPRADGKKRRIPIDWMNTKKTGVLCYHLNEHRDYYLYKIMWRKNRMQANISPYLFRAERYFKRKLGQILLHNKDIDYQELIR